MKRRCILTLMIILTAVFFSCEGEPLITEFVTSNLNVVIKGTYESNNPQNWGVVTPTKFMLDIAEIRMNGDSFAKYRKTYDTNLTDSDNFYNGIGVDFPCDDVEKGKIYDRVDIYFRKMIFNGCSSTVVFAEKEVTGFDFNEYQARTQAEQDAGSTDINRVFPKKVSLPTNFVYDNDKEYVLEIRLFVKNNVKSYSGLNTDLPDPFYAFNDTIETVTVSTDTSYIGGNVRVGVRVYEIGKTATIRTGTASTGSTWVCAVPSGQDPLDYSVPPIVTSCSGTGNYELQNVPVGMTWDIYSSSSDPSSTAPSAMGWAAVNGGSVTLSESQAGTVVAGP